jgi:hypothetical protein
MKLNFKFLVAIVLSFSFAHFASADAIPSPVCSVDKLNVAPNDQVVFTPSFPSSTNKFSYKWIGEASTTSKGAIAMAFIYPGNYTVALYATSEAGAVFSSKCPTVNVSLGTPPAQIQGGFYPYPFVSTTTRAQIPREAEVLPASCLNLTQSLSYGLYDDVKSAKDGIIYKLQKFLKDKGYLKANPSGYFGSLTRAAVQAFQKDKSIEPTGLVGPITRANIKVVSCSPLQ